MLVEFKIIETFSLLFSKISNYYCFLRFAKLCLGDGKSEKCRSNLYLEREIIFTSSSLSNPS